MIFDCGQTFSEATKQRGEWHDFFAIWPRAVAIVDGRHKCAWLQTIQRRSDWVSGFDCGLWSNEYRLKQPLPQYDGDKK